MKTKTTVELGTLKSGYMTLRIFRGGYGSDQKLELKTYDAFELNPNYRQRARRLIEYQLAYLRRFDIAPKSSAAILDQVQRAELEQRLYEAQMLEGSEMEY